MAAFSKQHYEKIAGPPTNSRANQAMRIYKVTVKHDKGKARLIVTARNESAARHMVREAEGCPDCAIVAVKLLTKR